MGHNRSRSRQTGRGKRKHPSLLKRINRNAAGIDCGSATHYVAVPPERDPEPVRSFKTFTSDLHRLADWLKSCGIESVAMDMWPAFIKATLEQIPEAKNKIAFDKFHVAKYLGGAVDHVRKQEH